MTILITSMLAPPADLLSQAIKNGDLEPLEHWFIRQDSPGYSFQTIVDFVEQERSANSNSKPKAKRAPSAKTKTRKATPTTKKEEVTPL